MWRHGIFVASITIDIYRGLSYKMAWNYYGFNETGATNPFSLAPIQLQDFNGSNATFPSVMHSETGCLWAPRMILFSNPR
jgi:hypothetical protein